MKFKNVSIKVIGANGELHLHHENNEYKNQSEEDVANIFNLEEMHYATELDGVENLKSFNTYNWNAPFTICGVMPEDIYDGVGVVNIHLGGDARGNYSKPYICEEMDALLCQDTFLDIELTNGDIYTIQCDNGEGYFDFDTFDVYTINFNEELSEEQIEEINDKMELV